jgi:hypothetical protein
MATFPWYDNETLGDIANAVSSGTASYDPYTYTQTQHTHPASYKQDIRHQVEVSKEFLRDVHEKVKEKVAEDIFNGGYEEMMRVAQKYDTILGPAQQEANARKFYMDRRGKPKDIYTRTDSKNRITLSEPKERTQLEKLWTTVELWLKDINIA